jgi:hypothetical protein
MVRRLANALLLSLVVVVAACGADESQNLAMEISEARWLGNAVVVNGTWIKGVSTPPACRLLEGRDGAIIGRFDLEGATFDSNTFSQQFVPDGGMTDAGTGYHVQCLVILDSAKTASDTVPVEGLG